MPPIRFKKPKTPTSPDTVRKQKTNRATRKRLIPAEIEARGEVKIERAAEKWRLMVEKGDRKGRR